MQSMDNNVTELDITLSLHDSVSEYYLNGSLPLLFVCYKPIYMYLSYILAGLTKYKRVADYDIPLSVIIM